ncbi:hypothetical protein [Luteolibacter flavescens]|nr:hypothetical protein [Luteolibacter flavescens]
MDDRSVLAEDFATGGFSRINGGTGAPGDRDGLFTWSGYTDPSSVTIQSTSSLLDGYAVGTGWDLFPYETEFLIGSITYDDTLVDNVGVDVVPITSIDLGDLWAPGSSTTDISDTALDLWFFDGPVSFSFGALDANDTVTFTNGVLTSINLSITASFSASVYGNTPTWNGTFSISGDDVALSIDDTETVSYGIFAGTSRFIADVFGTADEVGVYTD